MRNNVFSRKLCIASKIYQNMLFCFQRLREKSTEFPSVGIPTDGSMIVKPIIFLYSGCNQDLRLQSDICLHNNVYIFIRKALPVMGDVRGKEKKHTSEMKFKAKAMLHSSCLWVKKKIVVKKIRRFTILSLVLQERESQSQKSSGGWSSLLAYNLCVCARVPIKV